MALPDRPKNRLPLRTRALLALTIGVLTAWPTFRAFTEENPHRDFAQVWAMARALLHGQNPYRVIGPGLAYHWAWPLMYPLPAGLVAIPVAPFSEVTATVIFSGLAGVAFAWALTENGIAPLAGVFSAALMQAVTSGQWSPLLAGATAAPWLGILFAAKPTVGAVYFAYRPSWWPIVGGAVLVAISFIVEPTWLADWIAAIRLNAQMWYPDTSYRPIVGEAGGIFALACLSRWRRPEARLVTVLACAPLTPLAYETVALFLVPRTAGEAALMSVVSWGIQFHMDGVRPLFPTNAGAIFDYTAQLMAVTIYPLATLMVLRRPNEGPVPTWLEERISRWPAWLRGAPVLTGGVDA